MATARTIALPDKTMGDPPENVFIRLATLVTENSPHRNDTDSHLAWSIKTKLDEAAEKNLKEISLETSEISFLEYGMGKLREKGAMSGSLWYFLVDALRGVKE